MSSSSQSADAFLNLLTGVLDRSTGLNTQEQINRVINRVRAWKPEVDMLTTDREVIIIMEIPGVEEKSINIDVCNNKLTVSGDKTPLYSTTSEIREARKEIVYGPFSKSIILPLSVTRRESVQTELKNGMLIVTINKHLEEENTFNINFRQN